VLHSAEMKPASLDLSACLFPHSHASEKEVKRILSFFDSLSIFQPWHMEDRFPIPPEHGFKVLRPPGHLKPMDGFPSLLSEYKNWMRQHSDKGYASALGAIRQYGRIEDATWDIRRSIREQGESKEQSQAYATRWHLLLHLAREGEENLREAGNVLKVLRERGSPLRDAIGEGEPQGLLDDLSDFDSGREMEAEFVEVIAEAWNGLFGGLIERDAALVTLSAQVFERLSELSPEEDSSGVRFPWPDLSPYEAEELHSKRDELENNQDIRVLRDTVRRILRDPAGQVKELGELARGLALALPWKGKMLGFHVLPLGAVARGNRGMRSLRDSRRLLFHVEVPGHVQGRKQG
jgi:hypothetical protein